MNSPNRHQPSPLSFLLSLVALFGGALLIGALLAPHVFNLLVRLGRAHEGLAVLRDIEFERVASRTVLLCVLAGLLPALKWTGLGSRSGLGFTCVRSARTELVKGFGLGVVSIAVLYLAGWACGAYRMADDLSAGVVFKIIGYLATGLIVGLIEEALFRGAVFGVLRRGFGFLAASVASSIIFSAVHFAKPEPLVAVVYGHWYSGFALLPHMFRVIGPTYQYFPFMVTLFTIGLILAVLYEGRGSLYPAIGLHAGWIWLMKTGSILFDRVPERFSGIFGAGESISKSYAALCMGVVLCAGLLVLLRPRHRGFRPGVVDP